MTTKFNGFLILLGACMTVLAASADGTTWYYDTYKYDDYTWVSTPSAWKDANGTPATAFSPDDLYVLKTGVYGNNSTFQGGKLQVGVETAGNYFITINSGSMTSSSGFVFVKGFVNLNHYHAATTEESYALIGPIEVRSSVESPFELRAAYANDTYIVNDTLSGSDGTGLKLVGGALGLKKFVFFDASAFGGTFLVTSDLENSADSYGAQLSIDARKLSSSAKVDMGCGTVLQSRENGLMTLGGMTLRGGSRLNLTGTAAAHASFVSTGTVSVEGVVEVVLNWTVPVSATGSTVPVLQAPAAQSSFGESNFVLRPPACDEKQRYRLQVIEAAGVRSLSVVFDPVVELTSTYANEWDITKNESSSLEAADHWSDQAVPHAGADYWSKSKYLRTSADWETPYAFPGNRYFLEGGAWLFYRNDVRIPDLRVKDGELMFVDAGNAVKTLSSDRLEVVGGSYAAIGNYRGKWLELDVGLAGSGCLWLRGASRDNTTVPYGNYELLRASEDFVGTVCVSQLLVSATQLDFGSKFQTLRIGNDLALGGLRTSFEPAALVLARNARLQVVSNVTLSASLNRGVTVSGCGRFFVDEGKAFRCDWPITLDGDLYKEGSGLLALGGAAICRGGTNFTVSAGSLMPRAYGCCDGMKVRFAAGTGLVIPIDPRDEELTRWGLYLGKEGSGLSADDVINVTFDLSACPEPPSGEFTVGLFTVSAAAADDVRGRLKVQRKTYDHFGRKVIEIADVDRGLVTFAAKIRRTGFAVIVR